MPTANNQFNWLFGYLPYGPDPAWLISDPIDYIDYDKFCSGVKDIFEMFGADGSELPDENAPEFDETELADIFAMFLQGSINDILLGCKSLSQLKQVVEVFDHCNVDYSLYSSDLPNFGGQAPADTKEIYSWDDTHFLVSTRNGWVLIERT